MGSSDPMGPTGDERSWGILVDPLSTEKASDNIDSSDTSAVAKMILASDINTDDILYAPPSE